MASTGDELSRDDAVRRQELARFLRSRRARLAPGDLGLPSIGRRRVQGLRREEVAIAAGIGLTWYTRLETAADINVSADAITRIAKALCLTETERKALFELALPSVKRTKPVVLERALRLCVDGMRSPAFVLSSTWDVLYWNVAFANAWLIEAPGCAPFNALVYQFTAALERGMHGDTWEGRSRTMVAQFRADYFAHAGEPAFEKLLVRLREMPSFRTLYEEGLVSASFEDEPNVILHPTLGTIPYEVCNFIVPGDELSVTVQVVPNDIAQKLADLSRDT